MHIKLLSMSVDIVENIKNQGLALEVIIIWMGVVFIVGLLPSMLAFIISKSIKQDFTSYINVIGAGFLLGTCFFHLFPEMLNSFVASSDIHQEDAFKSFMTYLLAGISTILVVEQLCTYLFSGHFVHDVSRSKMLKSLRNLKKQKNKEAKLGIVKESETTGTKIGNPLKNISSKIASEQDSLVNPGETRSRSADDSPAGASRTCLAGFHMQQSIEQLSQSTNMCERNVNAHINDLSGYDNAQPFPNSCKKYKRNRPCSHALDTFENSMHQSQDTCMSCYHSPNFHGYYNQNSCEASKISKITIKNKQRVGKLRAVLLILSLSIHAVFEGIALTMQCQSWHNANQLGVSLIPHKVVVGMSLGFRLKEKLNRKHAACLLLFWSSITPLGQFLGVLISSYAPGIIWIERLNAFALGTFFYILFFEIVPAEFSHAHSHEPDLDGPNASSRRHHSKYEDEDEECDEDANVFEATGDGIEGIKKSLLLIIGMLVTLLMAQFAPHSHSHGGSATDTSVMHADLEDSYLEKLKQHGWELSNQKQFNHAIQEYRDCKKINYSNFKSIYGKSVVSRNDHDDHSGHSHSHGDSPDHEHDLDNMTDAASIINQKLESHLSNCYNEDLAKYICTNDDDACTEPIQQLTQSQDKTLNECVKESLKYKIETCKNFISSVGNSVVYDDDYEEDLIEVTQDDILANDED